MGLKASVVHAKRVAILVEQEHTLERPPLGVIGVDIRDGSMLRHQELPLFDRERRFNA